MATGKTTWLVWFDGFERKREYVKVLSHEDGVLRCVGTNEEGQDEEFTVLDDQIVKMEPSR